MRTLHLIMGKGRWDANALAEELECSRRTVHRLLQTLSVAGVPWYFDEKTRAYRVRPGYKFPLVEEQILAVTVTSEIPIDTATLVRRVIEDGESFAASLDELLKTLRILDGHAL